MLTECFSNYKSDPWEVQSQLLTCSLSECSWVRLCKREWGRKGRGTFSPFLYANQKQKRSNRNHWWMYHKQECFNADKCCSGCLNHHTGVILHAYFEQTKPPAMVTRLDNLKQIREITRDWTSVRRLFQVIHEYSLLSIRMKSHHDKIIVNVFYPDTR